MTRVGSRKSRFTCPAATTFALWRAFAAVALFAIATLPCAAIEVGLRIAGGNLQFPWSPVAPVQGAVFPATNFWLGGEAWFSSPIGEDATFRIAYERDPVLRNSLLGTIQFERGIARIAVGPVFGFLNTTAAPFSMGLSAALRLQWPGVAYFSMRSDGGLAISILQAGADPQARTEIAAGFYVPHAIVSGIVTAKRFNELDESGALVTDLSTRYALTIDVFKKNVPYTALASVGYEIRSKRHEASDTIDSLGAILLGLHSSAQINPALKLEADLSSGVYVFGLDALKGRGPANSSILFTVSLGFSLDLEALPPRAPKESPPAASGGASPPPSTAGTAPSEGASASSTQEAPSAEANAMPKAESSTAPATDKSTPSTTPAATSEKTAPSTAPAAAKSKLGFSIGPSLRYDARPQPESATGLSLILLASRIGARGALDYDLGSGFSAGAELGAYYIAANLAGAFAQLIDVPLYATVSWGSGSFKVQAQAGLCPGFSLGSEFSSAFGLGLDLGAKVGFTGFYLEGGYVLGILSSASRLRIGAGYSFALNT